MPVLTKAKIIDSKTYDNIVYPYLCVTQLRVHFPHTVFLIVSGWTGPEMSWTWVLRGFFSWDFWTGKNFNWKNFNWKNLNGEIWTGKEEIWTGKNLNWKKFDLEKIWTGTHLDIEIMTWKIMTWELWHGKLWNIFEHFEHLNIFGLCVSWINIFVLDITCQHLGDGCKLESFIVPIGHRVGRMYIFGTM